MFVPPVHVDGTRPASALAHPAGGYTVSVRCPLLATRLQQIANLIESPRNSASELAEEIVAMLDEQFRSKREVQEIGQEVAEVSSRAISANHRFSR